MAKKKRPPVVAVLGHVDHGKTSILDKIRETEVQAGEAGGITQSIGAYQVEANGEKVTFIDTPGHEAFTSMRARGGQAADLVVLVVAANDGVQPQTIEAINHARAADVPIIVALNKVDLDSAVPDKVKAQLADHDVQIRDYGGDVALVETSATEDTGLEELLKTILEESAHQNLRADAELNPSGLVIESFLDEKRGPVATVIVREGTLRVADVIIAGNTYAKVKALTDWQGQRLKEAGPSVPAEVLGFKEVPEAGVVFEWVEAEKEAREKVEQLTAGAQEVEPARISAAERIKQQLESEGTPEIPLVIKADTQGSLEALQRSLAAVESEEVQLNILHAGVGSISEADILLAASSESIVSGKGLVLGFRVGVEKSAVKVAQHEKVIYRTYEVIYHLIEELQDVIAGGVEALTPTVLGQAKIKEVFELSDGTRIAGCEMVEGKVKKGHRLQIVRGDPEKLRHGAGEIIGEARVVSLRRGKEEIGTAEAGSECGIGLKPQLEFRVGDVIQTLAE